MFLNKKKIKQLLMSSNTSIDKMNLMRTQSNKLDSTSESILNSLSTTPSTPTNTMLLPVSTLIDENLISDFRLSMASIPNNFTANNKAKTIVNRSRSEDSTHESDLSRLNSNTRIKTGSSSNLHSIDTNEISSSQIGSNTNSSTAEYADSDNNDTINDKSSPSSPNLNSRKQVYNS